MLPLTPALHKLALVAIWPRQVTLRHLPLSRPAGIPSCWPHAVQMGTFGWHGPLQTLYSFMCVASVVAMLLGPWEQFWRPLGQTCVDVALQCPDLSCLVRLCAP
jgi:hypothetical protein